MVGGKSEHLGLLRFGSRGRITRWDRGQGTANRERSGLSCSEAPPGLPPRHAGGCSPSPSNRQGGNGRCRGRPRLSRLTAGRPWHTTAPGDFSRKVEPASPPLREPSHTGRWTPPSLPFPAFLGSQTLAGGGGGATTPNMQLTRGAGPGNPQSQEGATAMKRLLVSRKSWARRTKPAWRRQRPGARVWSFLGLGDQPRAGGGNGEN